MTESRSLRIPLRVVFYRENEAWVAHCLEFDLAGDGETRGEALARLADAIAIQTEASRDFGNLSNLFSPADGELFRRFAAGSDVGPGPHDRSIGLVRSSCPGIDRVEVREYQESPGCVPA